MSCAGWPRRMFERVAAPCEALWFQRRSVASTRALCSALRSEQARELGPLPFRLPRRSAGAPQKRSPRLREAGGTFFFGCLVADRRREPT
jgi:hypothetical protein